MKRINLFKAMFALALPFILSLACGSSGPPSIGDVVTATSLDADYKPVGPTTSYQPTDTIYVSVGVNDLVVGSTVEIQYKLDGKVYEQSSLTSDQEGSGYYGFSLQPPTEFGFTPGTYNAEVYLDTVLAKTITFTVEGEATPAIVDVVLTKGLDADNKPLEPTTTFGAFDVIGLSVKVSNLRAGAEIKVIYTYSDGQTMENSSISNDAGSGYFAFTLSPGADGHPVGDYTLDVYLDGEPYSESLTFTVVQ
jgi:hypothetical protein